MAWRMIEVPDGERDDDLTSSELVAVSIMLAQGMGEPHNDLNVYHRAWQKLQPQVNTAMDESREDDAAPADQGEDKAIQEMLDCIGIEEPTEICRALYEAGYRRQ